MNESETRAEHIDPALKAAGWGVVEGSQIRREFGITQGNTTLLQHLLARAVILVPIFYGKVIVFFQGSVLTL